ncbi:PAP2 superfamily protein [Trichomonas vaginalis G3]|uniref:PAP2 superfamily protein n=1 Tax=Trichomonas vaginalis (strain ATCC PRA-98 / G3) TaxID=412133 RepID=A2DKB3_TRIV3|nr:PAP2 superfamily [Trichomonas vaginalis G3]EAY19090.1 PAP2 superfamily protein [Trichomonas vaginalis G3]KAI5490389.1 PAP2 superfamily [Trichomonas vaginalis G3]|eukprot:XP_001580076.1 PAP2 superfamily protein [Trichomonas vaginalis G3]
MTTEYCDVLGHAWYNRCWRQYVPDFIIHCAEGVGGFINIIFIGLYCELIQIALYFMDFEEIDELRYIFEKVHNLLVVPLCTILGLYMLFKQKRPCGIPGTDKTIGPSYGMPSGDALTAACFAVAYFKFNPYISIFLILSVAFSRVFRGFHSILQVCVGTFIGICYGLGVLYGGSIFCIFNWAVAATLPFNTMFDKNMKIQKKHDPFNFTTWMFSNTGMWLIDFMTSAPKEIDIFEKYGKRKMSIIAITITTILRVIQYIGAEEGWILTFV